MCYGAVIWLRQEQECLSGKSKATSVKVQNKITENNSFNYAPSFA